MNLYIRQKGENPMKYLLNFSVVVIAVGALTGCSMYSPSSINENPVQVSEERVTNDIAVIDADDAFIASLARHYTKHSGSPMDIVVTYDPKSRANTAMWATSKVSDIVGGLREYGVDNVSAKILPVNSQGSDARLLVSYNSFNAHAPKGCDVEMAGMNGDLKRADPDYKLGCAIDTMIARQIAKPAHLLGRGAVGGAKDGRSATNIVDIYRAGAQNKSLDGYNASDD